MRATYESPRSIGQMVGKKRSLYGGAHGSCEDPGVVLID
jgi:hypothetical protein